MFGLQLLDLIIILGVAASGVYSYYRGFVRELFSLGAILAGYIIATRFYGVASGILVFLASGAGKKSIGSESIWFDATGLVLTFITVALLVAFLGKIISTGLVKRSKKATTADRLIGGLLGVGKGAAVLVAIAVPLSISPAVLTEITKSSTLAPYIFATTAYTTKGIMSSGSISNEMQSNLREVSGNISAIKNLGSFGDKPAFAAQLKSMDTTAIKRVFQAGKEEEGNPAKNTVTAEHAQHIELSENNRADEAGGASKPVGGGHNDDITEADKKDLDTLMEKLL